MPIARRSAGRRGGARREMQERGWRPPLDPESLPTSDTTSATTRLSRQAPGEGLPFRLRGCLGGEETPRREPSTALGVLAFILRDVARWHGVEGPESAFICACVHASPSACRERKRGKAGNPRRSSDSVRTRHTDCIMKMPKGKKEPIRDTNLHYAGQHRRKRWFLRHMLGSKNEETMRK